MTAPPRKTLSPKALELGRGFLSTLFMGVRTAQIHDPQNKAFERAVEAVLAAAQQLYASSGGFSLSFIEEQAFLNGVRLRVTGSAYDSAVTLKRILESKELGGIEMKATPSRDAVRKLILLFSSQTTVTKEDVAAAQIGVLGVQRLSDNGGGKVQVDRRVFALNCYAKLMLAYREQTEALEALPRLRAVRVVQDLVELSGDRLDFLLRIGSNRTGAPVDELHAANTSVLAVALGRALELPRSELVDLGVSALLHDLGRSLVKIEPIERDDDDDDPTEDIPHVGHFEEMSGQSHPHTGTSFARIFASAGVAKQVLIRAIVGAEHHDRNGDLYSFGEGRPRPHLFSRIVAVAEGYDACCSGLGNESGRPISPLDALAFLASDNRFDPWLVDLLINVLRAFPVGTKIALDNGESCVVRSHAGGTRWDRPVVQPLGGGKQTDLMFRDGDRFLSRIVGTLRYLGIEA